MTPEGICRVFINHFTNICQNSDRGPTIIDDNPQTCTNPNEHNSLKTIREQMDETPFQFDFKTVN